MKNSKIRINNLLMGGILLIGVTFSSCKKSSDDPTLPPIGGFNGAGDVGGTSLVAYWSFDNTLTESKQNLTGTGNNTTYTAGKKGQAYQGSVKDSVVYTNAGTALPALTSFTISFWMNTPQYSDKARALFEIANDNDFWPGLHVGFEPYVVNNVPSPDTARFKIEFTKSDAPAYTNQFVETKIKAIGQWVQVIASYDAGTSKYALYINGAKIDLPPSSTNRYGNDPATGGTALGALKFSANKLIIGAWRQQVSKTPEPWMGNYEGKLDELRIYNKALSDADISSLYQLELAGR